MHAYRHWWWRVLLCMLIGNAADAQVTGGVVVDRTREPLPVASSLYQWVAQVKILQDQAWLERDGRRQLITVGMRLRQHDVLETGLTGAVGLMFNDNSTLSLGPRTHLTIQHFAFDTTTYQGSLEARIQRGTIAVQPGRIAGNEPEAMRISTPAAVVRSRAARYIVNVRGEGND
jgi:hypothetical protein